MCAEGWPSPERGLGHGRGTEGDGQGRQGAHEMCQSVTLILTVLFLLRNELFQLC